MEQLIEFVLRNMAPIIIIAGFVLTFLARIRRANNPNENPNPKMPTFGGDATSDKGGRTGWNGGFGQAPAAGNRSVGESRPSLVRDYESEPSSSSYDEERSVASIAAARSRPKPEQTAAGTGGEPARLRPDDAMLGMMWAEVLGPPRAKRKFGHRNR